MIENILRALKAILITVRYTAARAKNVSTVSGFKITNRFFG
jgi:hypothetical protein